MLKFPKAFTDHPQAAELEAYLKEHLAPLRPDSEFQAPTIGLSVALQRVLQSAAKGRHILPGLEQAADKLAQEEKGLKSLRQKTEQVKGQRMSRLLLLADDGADRFYRQAESVLRDYGYRVSVFMVKTSSEELGKASSFNQRPAKAVMLTDKKAMINFLAVLADEM